MKLTWKSFEDFSAITVDKGMVEDHLPTAVMAGLKRIRKQFIHSQFDPKETERIRLNAQEQYRQMAEALRRDGRVNGYTKRVKDYAQEGEEFENQTNQEQNVPTLQKRELGINLQPQSLSVVATLEDPSYYSSEKDAQGDTGKNAEPPTTFRNGTSTSAGAVAKMFVQNLQKSSVQRPPSGGIATQQQSGEVALEMERRGSTAPEELSKITSLSPAPTSHLV